MPDKKKPYVKAELRQTRFELGVYGCYGGGQALLPDLPIGHIGNGKFPGEPNRQG